MAKPDLSITFNSLETLDKLISILGSYAEQTGFEDKELDELERKLVRLAQRNR